MDKTEVWETTQSTVVGDERRIASNKNIILSVLVVNAWTKGFLNSFIEIFSGDFWTYNLILRTLLLGKSFNWCLLLTIVEEICMATTSCEQAYAHIYTHIEKAFFKCSGQHPATLCVMLVNSGQFPHSWSIQSHPIFLVKKTNYRYKDVVSLIQDNKTKVLLF